MVEALHVSIAALAVSFASLMVSVYSSLRDRGRLETKSTLIFDDAGEDEPIIRIEAANAGRRPLILRMWGGSDDRGEFVGTYIDREADGKRLGEHERIEFTLRRSDLGFSWEDNVVDFTRLWFEDTLGRRYLVKDSKRNIAACVQAWLKHRKVIETDSNMRKIIQNEVRSTLQKNGFEG